MKYDWNNNWIDLYKILEISRNATDGQIKKAYRKKVKKYHPDAYEDATEEEKEIARKIFEKIQLAYDVLSDKKEKSIYDSIYDSMKNGTYNKNNTNANNTNNAQNSSTQNENTSDDVDYDETMKNYSEATKRQAERLSVKKIICDEIESAKEYLETKNSILIEAYTKGVDKDNYFNTIVEFQELVYNYMAGLEELELTAYDYDLMECISLIDDTINMLTQEVLKFPKNIDEIVMYVSKEAVQKQILNDYPRLKKECNEQSQKMENLSIACIKKTLIPVQFGNVRNSIYLEVKDKIDYLEKLIAFCTKLELTDQVNDLLNLSSKLSAEFKFLPSTYEEACNQGKYILLNNDIKELKKNISDMFQIIDLIEKNQNLNLCDSLYEKGKKLIEKISKLYDKIKKISSDTNLNSENDLGKQIEKLNEEIINLFNNSLKLYNDISHHYSGKSKISFGMCDDDILPTSLFCKAIKQEKDVKELVKLYNFITTLDLKLPNVDIALYNYNLESAVALSRDKCMQNKTYNNNANTNTNGQTSNGSNYNTNTSTSNTNSSNSNFSNSFNNFLDLWNAACDPSMWSNASWYNFFTGDRNKVLISDKFASKKYMSNISSIFNIIKDKQFSIKAFEESEESFFGDLMLIDLMLLEYGYSGDSDYLYKEKYKNNNNRIGTPFILATEKLLDLWFEKREKIIIDTIISNVEHESEINDKSDILSFIETLDFFEKGKLTRSEVNSRINSLSEIYVKKKKYKEIQNLIEQYRDSVRWYFNSYSRFKIMKNEYNEEKQKHMLYNIDGSFDRIENNDTDIGYHLFSRYSQSFDDNLFLARIIECETTNANWTLLMKVFLQRILNTIKENVKNTEEDIFQKKKKI